MSVAASTRATAREMSETTTGWPIERAVSLLAGTFTLLSLGLGRLHDPRWRLMTGLIGTNLVMQAAVGWCPASLAMRILGLRTARETATGACVR
jgi:hypothetical protein